MARSEDCRWRFPLGGFGEVKSINDAGVEMFNSNSLRSLVRETLQNSLDASKGAPVLVEFEEYSVPFTAVPDSDGLRDEILHCAVSGGDDSPAAQSFLKHAIRIANRRSVRVMRISDYGTTGLRGATTCETGTDWSRLIKESESSSKGGSSGGSFGIGKYSSFACCIRPAPAGTPDARVEGIMRYRVCLESNECINDFASARIIPTFHYVPHVFSLVILTSVEL